MCEAISAFASWLASSAGASASTAAAVGTGAQVAAGATALYGAATSMRASRGAGLALSAPPPPAPTAEAYQSPDSARENAGVMPVTRRSLRVDRSDLQSVSTPSASNGTVNGAAPLGTGLQIRTPAPAGVRV